VWIKILIAVLGVIVVLLLFGTKVINWETIEDTEGASYNDMTVIGLILIGVCSTLAGVLSFLYFKVLSIVSLGLGVSCLVYGLHIAVCKGMIMI